MIRVQNFKSIVIFNIYMKESIRNFAKVANYIADDARKISLKYFKKKLKIKSKDKKNFDPVTTVSYTHLTLPTNREV